MKWPSQLIIFQEGIATCVCAVGAYWFIQNYPETATFITEKERRYIKERLASDSDATLDEEFTWTAVMDAFKDVKCWLYGLERVHNSRPGKLLI